MTRLALRASPLPGLRLALAAAAAVALAACSKADPTAARGGRPVPVRLAAAAEKEVPVEVRAVGRLVSAASVAVRAQVSGQLTAARFTEGQAVRQGEVLFEIDRRPSEAALAEARANLAGGEARARNARDDARRLAELAAREFVTRQQAEAAAANAAALEAALDAARAAVRRAELDLAWCTVRAPISGRTGRVLVQPGNLVVAGAAELVTIEQVRPIFAGFAIPARHLPALRARATPATVLVRPEGGAQDLPATVAFIDNAVDAGTGTVLLKARLPNQDEALWPGQVVEVRLRLADGVRSVVVPTSAVAAGQQGDYVWVVRDGAAALRPITTAQAGEQETVVQGGLAAGEQVVTEGQLRLVPGARVEALPAPGGAGPPGGAGGGGAK